MLLSALLNMLMLSTPYGPAASNARQTVLSSVHGRGNREELALLLRDRAPLFIPLEYLFKELVVLKAYGLYIGAKLCVFGLGEQNPLKQHDEQGPADRADREESEGPCNDSRLYPDTHPCTPLSIARA
jgi:hypothetical protein